MSGVFDVVIVGGGINGVGIAQAASAAGHSVLLLEKSELAAGSSSKSSKLVHGGLRYLESAELNLVHESLVERELMLKLAPDLVRWQPFHIPIYKHTRRRPWQIRSGLTLYASLAGLGPYARFKRLPKREWDDLDGLTTDGLQRVFRYYDAQTDDAALTRAVMRSAESIGARLEMPASFERAELTDDGVDIEYVTAGGARSCRARVLVNASGPWVNRVLKRVSPRVKHLPVDLVQGAHIYVRGTIERGVYYVESPRDGRAVFVMPWWDDNTTLIGTTETKFKGNPDNVRTLKSERNYLMNILGRYFPRLASAEVIDEIAGLRVLPAGGEHAFHKSREVILFGDRDNHPRVLSVYGGKLTTWRATAKKTLAKIRPSLPERKKRADTEDLMLKPE